MTIIKDLIDFPCDYLFKAFGPNDGLFADAVRAAASTVMPISLDAIRLRTSSEGAYVCVTLVVRLQNEKQLEAVYAALRQVKNLRYLL